MSNFRIVDLTSESEVAGNNGAGDSSCNISEITKRPDLISGTVSSMKFKSSGVGNVNTVHDVHFARAWG